MKIVITVLMFAALGVSQTSTLPPNTGSSAAEPKAVPRKLVLPDIPTGVVLPPMSRENGNVAVLNDLHGFDIGPYLNAAIEKLRTRWYKNVPRSARPPQSKKGTVVIRFNVGRNGKISDVNVDEPSGDHSLDDAALKAIKSVKFGKLPATLDAPYLVLSIKFLYNPAKTSSK